MTSLLKWRHGLIDDRSSLPNFTCTEPHQKSRIRRGRYEKTHAKPWEWRVQGKIRTLQPPYKYPIQMLVGEDNDGIAAVSVFEELDGPAQVDLCIMAIANRLRFKGGGYADEMAAKTWESIESRAIEHGVNMVLLVALVDERNEASQKFCRRMRMQHTGMFSESLQQWSGSHVLGDAPAD